MKREKGRKADPSETRQFSLSRPLPVANDGFMNRLHKPVKTRQFCPKSLDRRFGLEPNPSGVDKGYAKRDVIKRIGGCGLWREGRKTSSIGGLIYCFLGLDKRGMQT